MPHDAPRGFAHLSVDDVLITHELHERLSRPPDYEAESRTLVALAETMATAPSQVLQLLVEHVLELCHADSAGISILEPGETNRIFRWHATAGAFAEQINGTMSQEAIPGGTVIDRDQVLLFREVQLVFPKLRAVEPRIYESLVAPWRAQGKPIGTLWAIKHTPEGQFDQEDARLLQLLARFGAAAWSSLVALEDAKRSQQALEQRVAERTEALRESEAKYRALLEAMDEGYAVVEVLADESGRWNDFLFLEANDSFVKHTGMEFPVGRTVIQLLGTPNPRWAATYGQVIETGEPARFEEEEGTLGRIFDLSVFRIGGPESRRVAVLFTNITERREVEQALRASEERYRVIVEEATDYAIFTTDASDRIDSWGAGAEAVFGWRAEEVLGKSSELTFTPEDRATGIPAQEFATAREAGQAPNVRWHLRKDGSLIFIDGVSQAIHDATGTFQGVLKIGQDVTERHQAQEALRQSEERFRLMADAAPLVVWLIDAEGKTEYFNRQWKEYTGSTNVPKNAVEIVAATIHPDDQEATLTAFDQARRGGTSFSAEHRIRSAAGDYRWFLVRAEPNRDPQSGEIVRWFGASVDIHDRKLAEEAMRESEERYRTLFESIDQGFCTIEMIFDRDNRPIDYRFLEVNPAFNRTTGLIHTVGKRMRELAPDHEEDWFEIYGRIAKTGESARFESEAAALGRWYSVYAFRVGEPGDRRVAVLFEDITERRASEAELRASEERFRTMANLIPDLLWSSDPAGRMTWVNKRWLDFTGQSEETVLRDAWLVIHPEDRSHFQQAFHKAINNGHSFQQEMRLSRTDGAIRWFLARAEPLGDERGKIIQWFGSATDIHQERTTREELAGRVAAATAELRTLSHRLLTIQEEERRHLARELHDEIGQALTGLQLQLKGIRGTQNEVSAAEAESIVRDLTSRVSRLSMDLRPTALDTLGLLPALLWHVERYQTRTGIMVDLRHEGLQTRFPAAMEIAAFRIIQEALTNVARHAAADAVSVQLFADAEAMTIAIRDAGRGFDPKVTASTGGLSGIRERVELLSGSMEIESTPGDGTTLTVEMPLGQDVVHEEKS
jgi:PAS domain S-box-containing protein